MLILHNLFSFQIIEFIELIRILNTICIILLSVLIANGQTTEKERFFQVSGIITDDGNNAISNVGVVSLKLKRGSLSEKSGIYSITSTPGDTILFKALGFKKKFIILPQTFEGRHFYADVMLSTDTIPIAGVDILPWKTYSDFIRDMTTPIPVPPEIENMNDNLASVYAQVANTTGVRITPEAGYKYASEQNFSAMSTRGQLPVNNLLNPFAWAKFINGVKNGLLKNQRSQKPDKPAKVKARDRKQNKP